MVVIQFYVEVAQRRAHAQPHANGLGDALVIGALEQGAADRVWRFLPQRGLRRRQLGTGGLAGQAPQGVGRLETHLWVGMLQVAADQFDQLLVRVTAC